jgi:hypothetical protein
MSRDNAALVVSSTEELEGLRWWQQGSEELHTQQMLELRAANRSDRAVRANLEIWWDAALHGSFSAVLRKSEDEAVNVDLSNLDGGQKDKVDRQRYCDIMTKLGLALREEDEELAIVEARENAASAWEEEAGGREQLSKTRWLDSIFEYAPRSPTCALSNTSFRPVWPTHMAWPTLVRT